MSLRASALALPFLLAAQTALAAPEAIALKDDRTSRERATAEVLMSREIGAASGARVEGSDRPLAADRGRFERRARAREAGYRAAAAHEVDADAPADVVAGRVAAWAGGREAAAAAETPR